MNTATEQWIKQPPSVFDELTGSAADQAKYIYVLPIFLHHLYLTPQVSQAYREWGTSLGMLETISMIRRARAEGLAATGLLSQLKDQAVPAVDLAYDFVSELNLPCVWLARRLAVDFAAAAIGGAIGLRFENRIVPVPPTLPPDTPPIHTAGVPTTEARAVAAALIAQADSADEGWRSLNERTRDNLSEGARWLVDIRVNRLSTYAINRQRWQENHPHATGKAKDDRKTISAKASEVRRLLSSVPKYTSLPEA